MGLTTVTEALVVTIVPKPTNVKSIPENRTAKIPKEWDTHLEMMLTSSKIQEFEPFKELVTQHSMGRELSKPQAELRVSS